VAASFTRGHFCIPTAFLRALPQGEVTMIKITFIFLLLAQSTIGLTQSKNGHAHHQHPAEPAPSWTTASNPEDLIKVQFELINGKNQTVTEKDFRNQYLLISFGFSSCTYVCPTILSDWAKMFKELPEKKAKQLQAIMISLDPERDSPEHMDQFSKLFNPGFQGLSGSTKQIAHTAKNFRVTYHKVDIGDDYQINHSSMSYLVDPQGKLIDYFGFGMPNQQLAEKIAAHIP
jgi:protein SCO1/2